jgi:hypothetical protein
MTMLRRAPSVSALVQAGTLRRLHELIAALDRRVPDVARVGEVGVARAAEALRTEAVRRIAELEREVRQPVPPSDARDRMG